MQQLICPKCRANMSQYERNGVTIDQCMECRGIFLDRGELERLVDAEKAWNASNAPPPVQQQQPQPPQYGQPQYGQPQYGQQQQQYGHPQQHGQYQKHHKKKHNSFFEELFD